MRPTLRPAALVRNVRPIMVGDPSAFLELLDGGERGYWGKGEHWTAWGGSLAEIRLPASSESGGVSGSPSRFSAVRQAAERFLRSGSGGESGSFHGEGGAPRWFGGFSFLPRPSRDPLWEGFPEARFLLPRILLECSGSETRLVIQSLEQDEGQLAQEGATIAAALESASVRRLGMRGERGQGGAGGGSHPRSVERRSDEEVRTEWVRSVERVLREIDGGWLEKAVLARVRDVSLPAKVDLPDLLDALRSENPAAHIFLLDFFPDRVIFGAAPELLAELTGRSFAATVVAGSMPRLSSSEEDALQAARLLSSAKDRREHLLTAEEMTEALSPRLVEMRAEKEPRVLSLPRIHHLESVIEGTARVGEDVLSLVEALHPTPAVCGRPREEALACIREAERFGRGWYAGPVGWFDSGGEGSFVPALRTAVGKGERWRLFAGAGIVKGSLPGGEWDEISLKFLPALQALQSACGAAPEEG